MFFKESSIFSRGGGTSDAVRLRHGHVLLAFLGKNVIIRLKDLQPVSRSAAESAADHEPAFQPFRFPAVRTANYNIVFA